MIYQSYYTFPVGSLCIQEENGKIIGIHKKHRNGQYDIENTLEKETPLIRQAYQQLREYFNRQRQEFDLPLHLSGTEFQQKVWKALCTIPYGETCSYKDLARKIGNPKACRAVGGANNKNPIMIVIPCHRVIGANGSLVGYGGGLSVKKYLLELEKSPANCDSHLATSNFLTHSK